MIVTRLAVIGSRDHLPRLLSDLAALGRYLLAGRDDNGRPLTGIWMEHPSHGVGCSALTDPTWLASGSARPCQRIELAGIWALLTIDSRVSALTLLGEIVAAAGVVRTSPRGLFIPVFFRHEPPDRWRSEWQTLASAYPDLILPPVFLDDSNVVAFNRGIGAGADADLPSRRRRGGQRVGDLRLARQS